MSRCRVESDDIDGVGHVVECAVETVDNADFDFLPFLWQTSVIYTDKAPHEVKITVCSAAADLTSIRAKQGTTTYSLTAV